MSDKDEAEAKLRAEWLHRHKAPKNWIILTGSEVSTIRAELEATERERDEARNQRDILRRDAQKEAEHHDRMVGELERVYAERDEAREQLNAFRGHRS